MAAWRLNRVERGYAGPLYIEIAPRTFSIVVRTGSRLNQLRFRRGSPQAPVGELNRLHAAGQIASFPDPERRLGEEGMLGVTVDLAGAEGSSVIGFRARRHTDRIDVDAAAYYDPLDFWEPIASIASRASSSIPTNSTSWRRVSRWACRRTTRRR